MQAPPWSCAPSRPVRWPGPAPPLRRALSGRSASGTATSGRHAPAANWRPAPTSVHRLRIARSAGRSSFYPGRVERGTRACELLAPTFPSSSRTDNAAGPPSRQARTAATNCSRLRPDPSASRSDSPRVSRGTWPNGAGLRPVCGSSTATTTPCTATCGAARTWSRCRPRTPSAPRGNGLASGPARRTSRTLRPGRTGRQPVGGAARHAA